MLVVDGSTRIGCGGDVGCVTDWRTIGAAEVQLMSSKNHTLISGMKIGGAKTT
jgi:hypothetical protein